MKICFIDYYYPPFPGGSEIQAWLLTNKLKDLGNEVFVVTRSRKDFLKFHEMNGIKVYRVPVFGSSRLAKTLFTFLSIPYSIKIIKKNNLDVIISQELFATLAGHFSKIFCKKPFIYFHELTSKRIPTSFNKIKILAQRMIFSMLNCDKFVSLSKFIKDEYLSKWGIKKDIIVVSGGVDIDKFNPFVDRSEIRKKYSVGKDTVLFVAAKQLYGISAKGIEDSIKAFPEVVKKHKNVRYLILGDGDGRKSLENLVKKLHLDNYIKFIGTVPYEELPKYLSAADIIVQTFFIEVTFGMSLLEALASGRSVLVTETGEIKNILDDSTAMLVKINNIDSISNGMIKLVENKQLRNKLGRNSHKLIKENYSIEKMAKTFIEISKPLIKKYDSSY